MGDSKNMTGVSTFTHQGIIPAGSPLNRFITAYEKSKARNLWTADFMREIEDCVKEMTKECKVGLIAVYLDPKNRIVFEYINAILSRLLSPKDFVAALNQTVFCIFNFISEVCKDENFRTVLRDEFGLLQISADVLGPAMGHDELDIVLTCIELLTRDLAASWKAPYLRILIDRLHTFILNRSNEVNRLNLVLHILINMCRRNVSCVLVAHEDVKCKKVWSVLRACFQSNNRVCKQNVLIGHFIYLVSSYLPPHEFLSGYELVKATIPNVFEQLANSCASESVQILDAISAMMCSIGEKFLPIYERFETNQSLESGNMDDLISARTEYLTTISFLVSQIEQFVVSHNNLDRNLENSILQFLISTLHPYIQFHSVVDTYLLALKVTDKIFTKCGPGQTYNSCIKFYLQVAEVISERSDKQDFGKDKLSEKIKAIEQIILKALSSINLGVGPSHSQSFVELTTILSRLLSLLARHSHFSAKVLEKVDPEMIKTAIRNIASPVDIKDNFFNQRSVCVVELLYLMAQFTRESNIFSILLQQMSSVDVSMHVANCVQNGDEKTVMKAIQVSGSVGFSQNNVANISRSIISLRNLPPIAVIAAPDYNVALNSHYAVKRVSDVIRSINSLEEFSSISTDQESEEAFGNVIACYKTKQEMLECELLSLNNQISHLQKNKASMELLLKRQFELLSSRVLEQDNKQMEILDLQRKVTKTMTERESEKHGLKKELEKLQGSMEAQKRELEEIRNELAEKAKAASQFESELKGMKKLKNEALQQAKIYRQEKIVLTESLDKAKSALESMTAKCTGLEKELNKKQEELDNTLLQLEQQKQVVNTIRSVLGQNTFGGILSQNS